MSLENQETLLDTDIGGTVSIETNGRIIRPLVAIPSALVSECKIRADEKGIRIAAVDPANVEMVELQAHPGAFEEYDIQSKGDEVLTGVNLKKLKAMVADARMRVNDPDPVTLELGSNIIRTEIEREYVNTTVTRTDETLSIDPDAIRSEPDLPELKLPYHATLDAEAFTDTVGYFDDGPYKDVDIMAYQEQSGELGVSFTGTDKQSPRGDEKPNDATEVDFDPSVIKRDDDSQPAVLSRFTLDYLTDISSAIKQSKADEVRIHLGEEFPIKVDFWREDDDGETLYEGTFMQAPRINKDR